MTAEPFSHEWRMNFLAGTSVFGANFGQDYKYFGQNTADIIQNSVREHGLDSSLNLLEELEEILAEIKAGRIDINHFMERYGEDVLWDYRDKKAPDKGALKWFEAIVALLKENIAQKIAEEEEES